MSSVPEQVLSLARAIRDEGGRALLVGGCVRDRVMSKPAKDWDLEVYGVESARLREILERFGPVNTVGEAFTVYKLGRHLDVSIPRRERKSGKGHRAFVIEGEPVDECRGGDATARLYDQRHSVGSNDRRVDRSFRRTKGHSPLHSASCIA